ncbi:MAG: urease accessory protein, partial [Candidatus Polarisedimenticolia bacterium]
VGMMLVGLGGVAIHGAFRAHLHAHAHRHDGDAHEHLHFHVMPHPEEEGGGTHRHPHPMRLALRPLLVGGLHGLAGSAALSLLVLTTIPTVLLGCLYLGLFGAGSVAGMAVMSLVLAAPLALTRRRALWLHRSLRGAAGLGSLALGLMLTVEIGRGLLFG